MAQWIRHPPTKREIAGSSPVEDFLLLLASHRNQTANAFFFDNVRRCRLITLCRCLCPSRWCDLCDHSASWRSCTLYSLLCIRHWTSGNDARPLSTIFVVARGCSPTHAGRLFPHMRCIGDRRQRRLLNSLLACTSGAWPGCHRLSKSLTLGYACHQCVNVRCMAISTCRFLSSISRAVASPAEGLVSLGVANRSLASWPVFVLLQSCRTSTLPLFHSHTQSLSLQPRWPGAFSFVSSPVRVAGVFLHQSTNEFYGTTTW